MFLYVCVCVCERAYEMRGKRKVMEWEKRKWTTHRIKSLWRRDDGEDDRKTKTVLINVK